MKSKFVILIAEDDRESRLLFHLYLRNTNYELIFVENGLEAIEVVKSRYDIDLILMDIKMPEMDGFKAATVIKQINPNLPIIVQTAFEISKILGHPNAHLFDEIIQKPIDSVKLDLLIKKYLNI